MIHADTLATVNACLNGLAGVLLLGGRIAAARHLVQVHRRFMVGAFTVSVVFLISYLTRFAMTGTHRYTGQGAARAIYLTVLFSHMVLAAVTPFLAIRTLQLGLRGSVEAHRRLARITFPIWMYVSVTGVVVYWMLYHSG